MLTNKIFRVLNSFSVDDWKKFGKFLVSPYFVSGKSGISLYRIAKKYFSDKRRKNFTEEGFGKFLMNSGYFKRTARQTAHNRISAFCMSLEKYFGYRGIDNLNLRLNMCKEYVSRDLVQDSRSVLSLIEKKIVPENLYSGENETLQNIFAQKFYHLIQTNDNAGAFEAHRMQMKYFTAEFLESLFYYNLKNYFSRFYENREYPNYGYIIYRNLETGKILETLKKDRTGIFDRALIRYCLFQLFDAPDGSKYLDELNKLFFNNEERFPVSFRFSVYNYIESFYTSEINKGNKGYTERLFRLLLERERKDLMIDNFKGVFSLNVFTNFITAGLKVREFKAVEGFIEKYHTKLPKDIMDNEYNLNLSRLYFQKGDFRKSLHYISKTSISGYDKYHYIQSRLRLQIFFELKMYESAYAELDNLRHRVRNSKITPNETKNHTLDYIRIFNILINLKTGVANPDAGYLLEELSRNRNPMSAEWIAEKVSELKKEMRE